MSNHQSSLPTLLRAIALVSSHDYAAAAALLGSVEPLDPRTRYALGICQFATGAREQGLENVALGLAGRPGLLPYLPLKDVVDILQQIHAAWLANEGLERREGLSLQLAIGEGLVQLGRIQEATALFVGIIRAMRPVQDGLRAGQVIEEAEVRARVAPQPVWHSMDLGTAFIEGRKTSRILASELLRFDLPDLSGKSVLDIGAFDGFFSLEAERRGAGRVTALDYHSWVTDLAGLSALEADSREHHKATPDPYTPPENLVDIVGLPGRRAFDVARDLLGSKVETVCRDFRQASVHELGEYDVTLFLGVLYHLTDPFGALQKVHVLTREVSVIETLGVHVPSATDHPVWEFYKDDRVNQDPTTWWAPNECALREMLEAVGFRHVIIKSGVDTLPVSALGRVGPVRIVAHAWR